MFLKITLALSLLLILEVQSQEDHGFPDGVKRNWTSCEEFVKGSTLDPANLVNIDWKIFYHWHFMYEESYNIRFSLPTPGIVKRFEVELDGDLKPPVKWSEAVFFMETSVGFSGLFFEHEQNGIYRLIPSKAFEGRNVPLLLIGFKTVERYLGVMSCKHRVCYALAPADAMPADDELDAEAAKMNFRSDFPRSYVNHTDFYHAGQSEHQPMDNNSNDNDEDMDLEIEAQREKFEQDI